MPRFGGIHFSIYLDMKMLDGEFSGVRGDFQGSKLSRSMTRGIIFNRHWRQSRESH